MEASYPTDRDISIKSSARWSKAKAKDDQCGHLWRVHDSLYDFSKFASTHPGGKDWILETRGQDITEAVETMHWRGIPSCILSKYWVRKAEGERRYRYTFHTEGFYHSLKRKAEPILRQSGTEADWRASFVVSVLAGVFLGMSSSAAHNFFHQADHKAWRRYYFDLSCLSHLEWRISHALSHHLHTNSLTDVELAAGEPMINFRPESKSKVVMFVSGFLLQLLSFISVPLQLPLRAFGIMRGEQKLRPENLLPLIELFILMVKLPYSQALGLWFVCHATSGYWLIITSITTTHHHPTLWHAGDTPRTNTDWGLHQLDTVRDIKKESLLLVMTTFGDHLLHHMFPAVDHSKLSQLYPALYQTCIEHGETYPFKSLPDMVKGCHKQMARQQPWKRNPSE